MCDKINVFLPTRKGSERVINKNTRDFAGIKGGILRIKLDQLLEVEDIKEIILSTNDPVSMEIANSIGNDRIRVIERPEHLCLSSTLIEDLINYIPTVIEGEHIYWVNATSPLVTSQDYRDALSRYWNNIETGAFDSLMSVTKIQQFLWDAQTRNLINHDRAIEKWPRTQDLKPLYEINHAIYLSSRANYAKYSDRIGPNPDLFILDKTKSFDIDWEDDFKIAELLFNEQNGRQA